jgi:hypothetical protein
MFYLDFLKGIHETLKPPTYLEIGVRHGDSLALAHHMAIGVDPQPRLRGRELGERTKLYRQTSDEFFARARPLRFVEGHKVAFSFIDGLHHAEFALRDFINVERLSRWRTAVVFDDVLPRDAEMAARDRETRAWTGDIYKLHDVLATHRPDLLLLRIDTEPTGLLLVLGLDPRSTVLADRYDEIAAGLVTPDPQDVPRDVLERTGALDPQRVLDAGFLHYLRESRGSSIKGEEGRRELRRRVEADLGALTPRP